MCILIYPQDYETIDLYTSIQNEFIEKINNLGTESALEWLLTVKNGIERSHPQDITFKWCDNNSIEYIFELSKNQYFNEPIIVKTKDPYCTITNLENGTSYYWRVNNSKYNTFTTKEKSQRFIKIGGLLNVRDIGGKNIRQGLIYRGSELDCKFNITEEGKYTFCKELGIKTDLDLRFEPHEHVNDSPAGESVTLRKIKYRPYMEIFEEQYRKNICAIMELFADKSNYPIYIHCMGGADRTGMIAIYLRAIAGESENDIHLDYELTALSTYGAGAAEGADGFRSRNNSYYKEFISALDKFAPSKTLNEKVIGFLKDCGVSQNCIDTIYSIIKA